MEKKCTGRWAEWGLQAATKTQDEVLVLLELGNECKHKKTGSNGHYYSSSRQSYSLYFCPQYCHLLNTCCITTVPHVKLKDFNGRISGKVVYWGKGENHEFSKKA